MCKTNVLFCVDQEQLCLIRPWKMIDSFGLIVFFLCVCVC